MPHTPGPWIAEEWHQMNPPTKFFTISALVDGEPALVADSLGCNGGWIEEEEEADNARLIAAAPDLLSALQSLLPKLFCRICMEYWTPCGLHGDINRNFSEAQAAIAKATGQE